MAMKMICGHYFQIDLMPYSTVIILNHNIKLDEGKGKKTYLSELAKTIDTPGHDAYLTIENGQVVLHPAKRVSVLILMLPLRN